VPEAKRGKNRLHLDLRTADLDAEVGRVIALGAVRLTSTPITEGGWRCTSLLTRMETNSAFCSRPPGTGYPGRPFHEYHRSRGIGSGLWPDGSRSRSRPAWRLRVEMSDRGIVPSDWSSPETLLPRKLRLRK